MSFILLGKHPDDRVVLLSEEVYASRKDATDALSGLTSESSFSHWDAEVFVVDIDTATPVLLVRPAAASEISAEPEAAEVSVEDEAIQHAGSDVGEPDEDTESLVVEESAEGSEAGEAPGDVDLSAALSELGLAEDEPEATQEAPAEDSEEGAALRDAIARTTAQMAASGIVPPESVGPDAADEAAEEVAEEAGAAETPEDALESEETVSDGEEALDVPAEPVSEEAQAWPWASEEAAEQAGAFELSALEEPGVDEGSLVKAAGDDETMDVARPVILGDYDDMPAAEPMSVAMADAIAASAEESEGDDSEELAAALAAAMAETGGVSEPDEQSAEPAADAAATASPADGLTCDDCVYFQTCPNKEDRTPSSCGSFQWK